MADKELTRFSIFISFTITSYIPNSTTVTTITKHQPFQVQLQGSQPQQYQPLSAQRQKHNDNNITYFKNSSPTNIPETA